MSENKLLLNNTASTMIERAMAIMAHPDDPEFFIGGTLAKLAAQGTEVRVLLVTDGSKGSDDRELSKEELTRMRRAEQREAVRRWGGKDALFFDHSDGELRYSAQLVRDVVREIRRFKPQLVLTNDPARFYYESGRINHTDHRTIGAVVLDAVFPAARNFRYFPSLLEEGFETWYVREIWLCSPLEANHEVNTEDMVETRLNAILAHTSQVGDGTRIHKRIADQRARAEPFIEKFKRLEL